MLNISVKFSDELKIIELVLEVMLWCCDVVMLSRPGQEKDWQCRPPSNSNSGDSGGKSPPLTALLSLDTVRSPEQSPVFSLHLRNINPKDPGASRDRSVLSSSQWDSRQAVSRERFFLHFPPLTLHIQPEVSQLIFYFPEIISRLCYYQAESGQQSNLTKVPNC